MSRPHLVAAAPALVAPALLALALLALALLTAAPAGAATCTAAAAPLGFGAYDPLNGAAATSTSYVDLRCTCTVGLDCVALPYAISISAGVSGNASDRDMAAAGMSDALRYNLYQDPAHSVVWGSGAAAEGGTYAIAAFGGSQRAYVYGLAPANQNVRGGAYRDSPAVTVSF